MLQTYQSWLNQLVLSTRATTSWPSQRKSTLPPNAKYLQWHRRREGEEWSRAVSNSSLDVGYGVGYAAEQDQMANIPRKWETLEEERLTALFIPDQTGKNYIFNWTESTGLYTCLILERCHQVGLFSGSNYDSKCRWSLFFLHFWCTG